MTSCFDILRLNYFTRFILLADDRMLSRKDENQSVH